MRLRDSLATITARPSRRPPPVVVVGMHRSGTSAVSRLLHDAGVNMGYRQDGNGESLFFLRINHWLLRQCGATWANVDQIPELLAEHADALEPVVERRIRSLASIEHFGLRPETGPWGIKDPRISMLYPLYDRLFPECRFVVVSRHGVDVAQSLRSRAIASAAFVGGDAVTPLFGVRQPRSNRMQNAVVASDLDRNLRLWSRYQESLEGLEPTVGGQRVLRLRFEDLVRNPAHDLKRLSDFVGVTVVDTGLNADRAFVFESSPDLAAFARTRARELSAFGYQATRD